jgi:cytochrome P450
VTRRCVKQTTIKGIDIPVNLVVAVDVLSIHYDQELWGPEDPNEFNPSRFSCERKRHPMAYQAFGQGPRNCIGNEKSIQISLYIYLSNF